MEYVSGCISRGDFAALENVVTQDALQELKRNISIFTLQQRQELALSKEDIYFCFPYEIGIMFVNDDSKFVRVNTCSLRSPVLCDMMLHHWVNSSHVRSCWQLCI